MAYEGDILAAVSDGQTSLYMKFGRIHCGQTLLTERGLAQRTRNALPCSLSYGRGSPLEKQPIDERRHRIGQTSGELQNA